jgi:hypothetical protein
VVAVVAYHCYAVEVIGDLPVEQVRNKRDIHGFFFTATCMAVAFEKIESDHMAICSDEPVPPVLPRLAWRRCPVETRV